MDVDARILLDEEVEGGGDTTGGMVGRDVDCGREVEAAAGDLGREGVEVDVERYMVVGSIRGVRNNREAIVQRLTLYCGFKRRYCRSWTHPLKCLCLPSFP